MWGEEGGGNSRRIAAGTQLRGVLWRELRRKACCIVCPSSPSSVLLLFKGGTASSVYPHNRSEEPQSSRVFDLSRKDEVGVCMKFPRRVLFERFLVLEVVEQEAYFYILVCNPFIIIQANIPNINLSSTM